MVDIHNDRSQEREKNRARREQEETKKEQRRTTRLQKEKEGEEKGVDLCKMMMEELAEKGIEKIAPTQSPS